MPSRRFRPCKAFSHSVLSVEEFSESAKVPGSASVRHEEFCRRARAAFRSRVARCDYVVHGCQRAGTQGSRSFLAFMRPQPSPSKVTFGLRRSGGPGVSAPSGGSWLLQQKVLAPELPAGYVSRASLLQRLEGVLERRLTVLQAPAGFGKTTVLADVPDAGLCPAHPAVRRVLRARPIRGEPPARSAGAGLLYRGHAVRRGLRRYLPGYGGHGAGTCGGGRPKIPPGAAGSPEVLLLQSLPHGEHRRAADRARSRAEPREGIVVSIDSASDRQLFSRRELDVLSEAARGLRGKEIGGRLGISYEGVRYHLKNIYRKAGVSKGCTTSLWCAVRRRHSSAGANPARQLSFQPVAVGADDGGNDIA